MKPLVGIRVLDFTRVLAGPFCTALLADLGADVIKVESPSGDEQRGMGAIKDGVSISFELINRNKRSLRLDLKQSDGRSLARKLAAQCDVVIENFRPGVTRKLGIDYDSVKLVRPDVVYCSISGFGQEGPLARDPSYDVIAQAMSGLMSVTGQLDGEPTLVGDSIGDTVSGLFAAWAISTALYRRATTGEGARLDIALFDSLFSLLPTALAEWQLGNAVPRRRGNHHPFSAPFGTYRAADGSFVIAIASSALFERFAKVIGRPDLATDTRFSTDPQRKRNDTALRTAIEAWSIELPATQAVQTLRAAGVPASEIWDVARAADSGHAVHRRLLATATHQRLGSLRVPEQPVHIEGLARGGARAAPRLGEHGPEVLAQLLGMDADAIASLKAGKVI